MADAEFQRQLDAARSEVQATWQRLARRHDWWALSGEAPIQWSSRTVRVPLASRSPAEDFDNFDHRVFEVLFATAEGLARDGRPAEALIAMREALEAAALTGDRARGLCRSVQLAARSGDAPGVLRQWQQCVQDLDGTEPSPSGISLLLCAGLAAAPHLPLEEVASLRSRLVELWVQGGLALPPVVTTRVGRSGRVAIRETEIHRRLRQCEFASEPGIADFVERHRAAALYEVLGELPESPGRASVRFSFHGGHVLVYSAGSEGRVQGVLLRRPDLDEVLHEALGDTRTRAAGFVVELGGAQGGDAAGALVLPDPVALEGEGFAFRLRHPKPEALRQEARAQVRWLRAGLGLVSLLCALGGALAFRALRKDRRLQEMKARFIASVSHELRTPLSSILLLAENLSEDRVQDEARRGQYYRSIHEEAARLRRLVDDVLDFSRLEKGEAPRLRQEPVRLDVLARQLGEQSRVQVESAGAKLVVLQQIDRHESVLDAEAIGRAVRNLVENALRHGGGAEIHLLLQDEGAGLCIAVRDFGRGIPRADRRRVLRPFQQASHGAPSQGTGLGLSIVQAIAEGHGGELRVEAPEQGAGCLVEIRIPWKGTG